MSEQCAVPLCLPNNCKRDAQTGEYSKSAGPRESLCVTEAAIERLKSIRVELRLGESLLQSNVCKRLYEEKKLNQASPSSRVYLVEIWLGIKLIQFFVWTSYSGQVRSLK